MWRSTTTPIETTTNANSVPMLVSSDSFDSGTKPARIATSPPVMAVISHGVPYLGCTRARPGGSSRSRDMANSTRDWPSSSTRITVVMPQMAPSEISRAAHSTPLAENASASGAPVSRSR